MLWLQAHRPPWLGAVARLGDIVGSEVGYLLALPAVYWAVDRVLGRRLLVAFLLSAWLNTLLKAWFDTPRPFLASTAVEPLTTASLGSLPSGHAQLAATVLTVVALTLRRPVVTGACALAAGAMALSRVICGVHYPIDVLAGLALGLLVGVAVQHAEPRLARLMARSSLAGQLLLIAGGCGALALLQAGLNDLTVAGVARSATAILGALAGTGLGLASERRSIRFDPPISGSVRRRLVGLGWLGLAVCYLGLKALFDGWQPWAAWRLARYFLVAVWVTAGLPWLGRRLGLAPSRNGAAASGGESVPTRVAGAAR